MDKRIEDANRIRALWKESVKLQPGMGEAARIDFIAREARRRTPSGNFVYLASFKSSEPSMRWIRLILAGRTDNGSAGKVIGEPLIKPAERRIRNSQGLSARMTALELRVTALEEGLGVTHATQNS